MNDLETARAFLIMQRRWTWADYDALKQLIARNDPVLSASQYGALFALVRVVAELLHAETTAAYALGLPVTDAWLVVNRLEADL